MKHIIRKDLTEKRNKLKAETVKAKSELVRNNLFETKITRNAGKIGLYFSKQNEVSTEEIILTMLKEGKRVFLPRIKEEKLEFKEIKELGDLEKGSFGIKEPKESCLTIAPKELDLIITPCVAVDENGNRVGRGAGFYDRFLAEHEGINTVCLAYDFQVLQRIETNEHDQKADLIITDKRVIKTKEANLLNGKKLADELLSGLKKKIEDKSIKAKLAVILVGSNPASEIYVRNKEKKCKSVGIDFESIRFTDDVSEAEVKTKIKELNQDNNVTGILVQLPLPKNLNTDQIINTVLPKKDVDGLTRINIEKLARGDEKLACPTPKGIIRLLEKNRITLKNKKIVLVGCGKLVGKPMVLMLKNRKLKFTVCDDRTQNLKEKTKKADILISATGVPHLIKEDFIKKGAIIIDVGICKLGNNIVGDVNFEKAKKKASWITPVPGGVGPMTIAMLIENIVNVAERGNE